MNVTTLKPPPQSAEETAIARDSGRALAAVLSTRAQTQEINLRDDAGTMRTVTVPTEALRMLAELLTQLGMGNAVHIIPIHAELTTQEAANMLDVSRPHLVSLLEANKIPFRKVGRHRRLRFEDVLAFKKLTEEKSDKAFTELVRQAQELDMGY
jgi:excisionase family DNA binding protein